MSAAVTLTAGAYLRRREGAIRYHGPVDRWAAAALLAFVPAVTEAAGIAPLAPRPRLVLVVSVDQLRFD